jgi:N-acylneuraminate cytidylyltransferase
MNNVAIILARGGSKGIPDKNIKDFCGKPLIVWTIENCLAAKSINSTWVSSDSEKILDISKKSGARVIQRPISLSDDNSSSESAWLHAISEIEKMGEDITAVIAPQVTSPLREPCDIDCGIDIFYRDKLDSLFSCSLAEDICLWQYTDAGELISINYNWKNRKRRQEHSRQLIENGSFYIFKPDIIRNFNNRLGGQMGTVEMDFWKMFEVDSIESFRICEALMKEFILYCRDHK